MDTTYDVSSPRKLARHWSQVLVIPGLAGPGPATPSSHRSKAAEDLLDNTKISLHTWNYPGPPESFLDHTWDLEWDNVKMAFGSLGPQQPCDLKETPVLEKIVTPALECLNVIFFRAFKIILKDQNIIIVRDQKGVTKTAPDISAYLGNLTNNGTHNYFDRTGERLAFMEGKGPMAAGSDGLNEGLDSFCGHVIGEYAIINEDHDETALKILGQVLEACYKAQLKVGCLIAPPFLFRPICFMGTADDYEAHAFLGNNQIPQSTDVRNPEAWENFFCQTMWFSFCIWVKALEQVGEEIKGHPRWKEWKDAIEGTIRPDKPQMPGSQKPLEFLGSILRPIKNILQYSLSCSFNLLGPQLAFKFIKSFDTGPVTVSSIISSSDWTHFIHAPLPPDSIMYRDFATICLYQKWGFVIKYALEESGFERELKALQGLASMERSPSLIAHGTTAARPWASSVPFLVMTYHGAPLQNFDKSIVNHLYNEIVKPMHELGWHHHDIKPDNIMIDAHGKLTIIDFNLAVPFKECKQRTCPDQVFLRKWGIDAI